MALGVFALWSCDPKTEPTPEPEPTPDPEPTPEPEPTPDPIVPEPEEPVVVEERESFSFDYGDDDEQGEQIQILFSSTGEATYNIWLNGKQEITSEANYTYSYSRPNIKLTPKQADMPTFTGRIISNGTYSTMHLTSTDGATMIVLTHQIDKSDTIWQ